MMKKLPIGIESFEELITQDFYYVDKTAFISELLDNWGKVNLFTRPRRFGKSLNMSMLKAFFEIGTSGGLFSGLAITQNQELCQQYFGRYPVISLSLKGVDGNSFEAARESLRFIIGTEARRFSFLSDSIKLTEDQKASYRALIEAGRDGSYSMSDAALEHSLHMLTALLQQHYQKKTIILIDEYDVPLDKAFQAGYYPEMVRLIRSLLSNVLKTNDSLQFAVLTGCLRISKESIFTGLNNMQVFSMTDKRFGACFGFTEPEVLEMLSYYGLSERAASMKDWYDGYRFGDTAIYCPWDVINFCSILRQDIDAFPVNFWANTSGNGMVRRFIERAQKQTRDEIERLIDGESLIKAINPELTYDEIDRSVENLWSVLLTTGYLTQKKQIDERRFELAIPNREIRELFIHQIQEWFHDAARKDAGTLDRFCRAFSKGEPDVIQEIMGGYLWNAISIRDTASRTEMKENFYHGLLLGLLQYAGDWKIQSNAETGEGYGDILIETPEGVGIVIELKYAHDGNLDKGCQTALEQIGQNRYAAKLKEDGMETIMKYGIAFYKKRCKVMEETL